MQRGPQSVKDLEASQPLSDEHLQRRRRAVCLVTVRESSDLCHSLSLTLSLLPLTCSPFPRRCMTSVQCRARSVMRAQKSVTTSTRTREDGTGEGEAAGVASAAGGSMRSSS